MNLNENPATSSAREAVVNVPPETTYGDGVINNALALEKPILRDDWQTFKNVDPAGDYNTAIPAPVVEAAHPSGPAAIAVAAPPERSPEPSTKIARQLRIINKRRVPNSGVQDVNVGQEVLVVNTSLTTIDQPEAVNENQELVVADIVDAFYESTFRELGLPATEDNPAEPSLKAVSTVKGSDHVPSTTSEGGVATFFMDVDEKGLLSIVPSLDLRRPILIEAGIEDAEVLANLG